MAPVRFLLTSPNIIFRFALATISIVSLIALLLSLQTEVPFVTMNPNEGHDLQHAMLEDQCAQNIYPAQDKIPPWDPSLVLKGPPTTNALDNLRDDKSYVTGWTVDGITNQFIAFMNTVYLRLLSDRIPIIPPFTSNFHLAKGAPPLPFGDVFNISTLREAIRYPIVEWREVKQLTEVVTEPTLEEREQIGCWSTSRPTSSSPVIPTDFVDLHNLRLDPSYTRVPREARLKMEDPDEYFVNLNEIVPFISPERPQQHGEPVFAATLTGEYPPPNTRLACFDYLYYASSTHVIFEWERAWSPMWTRVGKNARFTDALVDLARQYIANAFSADRDNLPPFVAVHMRRTDFQNSCEERPNCLVPFSSFERKVNEIKEVATAQFGFPVERVLLFSDDESEEFWRDAKALGWHKFDHSGVRTVERFGHWYPTLIDVVAQSMAHGFVGTGQSTFSLLALRRVTEWQGGPTAMLWG